MKFDGIIFDMDGTLWDTVDNVCAAWNASFAADGVEKRIDAKELSGYMGLPMDEIAERVFVGHSYDEVRHIFDNCMRRENEYLLKNGGGILYPGLIDTLRILSAKVPLYIVSNCQSGYIEVFFEVFGTRKFFRDWECFGNTGELKAENIRKIVERNGIKKPVYVGDTMGDYEACQKAGVPFIYAAYGFGEVDCPDYRIGKFADLPELVADD